MDSRLRYERAATFRECRMAQLLDFVQPRKLGLKILLRIALCARRDGTLSEIKSQNRQRGNH